MGRSWRRRWPSAWPARGREPAVRAAGVGGWAGCFLAVAVLAGSDGEGVESARGVAAEGERAYASGDFARALARFERAVALEPDAAVPRFDAGAALYRLGRWDEAEARYLEARDRADAALRAKIDFALGNTAMLRGDLTAAVNHYDDCIASRAAGAGLDAVRRDAAVNRAFALGRKPSTDEPAGGGPNPAPKAKAPGAKGPEPDEPRTKQERDGAGGDGDPTKPPPGATRPDNPPPPDGDPNGRAGSAASKLDKAMENARRARERRLDDEPPPLDDEDDRKDW